MSHPLRAMRSTLIETMYPRRCAGCRRRGIWVCADCVRQLPHFEEPWCGRCGVPPALGRCACANLSPAIDLLRSVAAYDGWLRQAIVSFKYHDEWSRADHLGALLGRSIESMPPVDALVPVPLHAKRLRQRGFNQSMMLADVISRKSGLPVRDLLLRAKPTMQQVGLSAVERHQNVMGAFTLRPGQPVEGGRFVLIDDVVTTGSTLGACAEALSQSGATFIGAATLAHERRSGGRWAGPLRTTAIDE